MPVESMTREERRAWLAATAPRHDLMQVIRSHIFRSSRPWPDGTEPTAPNWNPGCSCGEAMYFFQWDGHLAGVLLAAGYIKVPAVEESGQVTDGKAPTPAQVAALQDALGSGSFVVCYTKCWPCQFGECLDPPRWHTWADADDVEHADARGRPDPSQRRCGCDCAKADKEGQA